MVAPQVAIVPVDVNSLGLEWAVGVTLVTPVIVFPFQQKLSSLNVVLINCVKSIDVDNRDDEVFILLEEHDLLLVSVNQSMK